MGRPATERTRTPRNQPYPLRTITPVSTNHRPNHPSFVDKYTSLCNLLLSQTRSRSLRDGVQLHAHIIKSGIQAVPFASHHLINFYSKTRLPCLRSGLQGDGLEDLHHVEFGDLVVCAERDAGLAVEYFCRMVGERMMPDDHIFSSVFKACGILRRRDVWGSVHCLAMKTGFEDDVFVGSSVVDMYAKCGEIGDARKVFDKMPMRNIVSWSGMIDVAPCHKKCMMWLVQVAGQGSGRRAEIRAAARRPN